MLHRYRDGQGHEGGRSNSSALVQLHSFHSRHHSIQPFLHKLRAVFSFTSVQNSERQASLDMLLQLLDIHSAFEPSNLTY